MGALSPLVDLTPRDGQPPLVSIVVVTHGTGPVVVRMLASIGRHTSYAQHPFEVVVVDNPAANGRTSALLHETTTGVRVVPAPHNLGFGGGCNLGVEMSRGEFVCLANPDLVVTEGWLEPLLDALRDPQVAIAAPVLLHEDGTVQEAGQVVFRDGGTDPIGGPRLFPGDRSVLFDRDVDYASAACWVLARSTYVGLGGFDQEYHPAYFEDADLAMRVEAAAGKVTRLVTARPVIHLHGEGTAADDGSRARLAESSRQTFEERWADELAQRPERPTDEAGALDARDRACRARWLVLVACSDLDSRAEIRDMVDAAAALAARRPRDRVTLAVDVLADEERHRRTACRLGLELVVGDLQRQYELRAERASGIAVSGDAALVAVGCAPGVERAGAQPVLWSERHRSWPEHGQ